MTAVALLFALFQLTPAPFCMLDEVDAPLDDANVSRYCDMIRHMSEDVQFIIISHNKLTMELADRLHGVTCKNRVSRGWSAWTWNRRWRWPADHMAADRRVSE